MFVLFCFSKENHTLWFLGDSQEYSIIIITITIYIWQQTEKNVKKTLSFYKSNIHDEDISHQNFRISHFTFHKRIIFKFFFPSFKAKTNKHGEHMQHIVSLSTIFHHHHFVQTNSIICFMCGKENLHVMFFLQKSKSNQNC